MMLGNSPFFRCRYRRKGVPDEMERGHTGGAGGLGGGESGGTQLAAGSVGRLRDGVRAGAGSSNPDAGSGAVPASGACGPGGGRVKLAVHFLRGVEFSCPCCSVGRDQWKSDKRGKLTSSMLLIGQVINEREESFTGKRGLQKVTRLDVVDVGAERPRLTSMLEYGLREDELPEYGGGKLEGQRVRIAVEGIEVWNAKFRVKGRILGLADAAVAGVPASPVQPTKK